MATEVIVKSQQIYAETAEHDFSWLEKFTLMCFHPRAIFVEVAGFIWSIYYFWNYNWQMSLGVFVFALVLALLSVIDTNPQRLSETTIGKIGLLHLHPMNLTVRLAGAALLLYGIWQRSLEFALGGLSVIFLGHTFGWAKVDPRFDRNTEI
jgi:hypothetical protein